MSGSILVPRSPGIGRRFLFSLILIVICSVPGCAHHPVKPLAFTDKPDDSEPLYYRSASIGSDSQYNPASAFFNYTFDTLQLTDNFDTQDYGQNLSDVLYQLTHPRQSINNEGGFGRFVNREIFPIDSEHRRDSFAALPNYALHLLGDGMAFRRDMEWFQSRGYRYPRLAAASLAMISELLQEGLEAQNTTDADAVADVYLFRPLGLLLFSNRRIATAIRQHLDPAIWPTQISIDLRTGKLINAGLSYIYRPPSLVSGKAQLFFHTGLNNLIGVSYQTGKYTSHTVAIGVAIEEIVRQRDIQADVRPSLGVFKDRRGSLLWSAVINDVGRTRFRLNLFPGAIRGSLPLGIYVSLSDEWNVTTGIRLTLPLGVGISSSNSAGPCDTDVCPSDL